jgi:uncharacterized protein YhbP (UPF0306 family)
MPERIARIGATSFANIRARDVRGIELRAAPTAQRLGASVLAILGGSPLCAMSTVTADGLAHVNTAYFSYSDALDLIFLSHPDSLHSRNLERNPSMAVAVFATAQEWGVCDRGLQLFGACALAPDADAWRSYAARFVVFERWHASLSADALAREYRLYRFEAASVRVLDERNLGDGVLVDADVTRDSPVS